jgi:predicted dehydrogenase
MADAPAGSRRQFLAATAAVLGGAAAARADDPPLAPPDRQPPDLKLPEPEKKTGWAVVGLGTLAVEQILPAFARSKLCKPTALVSGHPDKAKRLAAVYGVEPKSIYTYENYDKLADDPAVDVVYVVLPNSMHAEFTVRALKAGKHVLCEKPMASNAAECEAMIAAAKAAGRKLMLAYRLHYEPFNMAAIELCRTGAVGPLRSITATNLQVTKAPNIRLSKALAGGPVQDVGVYCLNAARYLTGKEPVEVSATAHQPADIPRFREVPATVAFTLRFPDGVLAHCDCSFDAAESRRFRVTGTTGWIDMENAFGYSGQQLTVSRDGRESRVRLSPVDHFAAEMDHFAACVQQDKPPRTPGEEGLADMRVIEAIERSAKEGRAVKL